MEKLFLICALLLPLAGGIVLCAVQWKDVRRMRAVMLAVTAVSALCAWGVILTCSGRAFELLRFTDQLVLVLRPDDAGRFFCGIVATLWPLTAVYSLSYMEGKERQGSFFGFFTMACGITVGIALSGNLFTLYCFYELLTLSTVPLVMHSLTKPAVRAARRYFAVCLGGAAFGFASMAYLIANGAGGLFTPGGLLTAHPGSDPRITQIFFLLGFCGFGVKAALFPACGWLSKASVAHTPVTALLHAVAVVKSGAFAVMRLTWFCFTPALLRDLPAASVVQLITAFTIVYGAVRAVKETHWKRRLAWSTVANLSYILFGVSLMTPAGMRGALLHMAFHAEIKILAFFCAGSVLHVSGVEQVRELDGLGRRMPVTFACFTVSAIALTGIPPFSGFVSKWSLLTAAAESATPTAYVGAGALLLSALLCAIYMFSAVQRAWFPGAGSKLPECGEADRRMLVPMVLLAAGILMTGVFAQPIVRAASAAVGIG